MTNHGYSILQTIESNAIGAAVGAIVGGTVSGLYKRAVRLEARRIEAALLTLDHLLGGTAEAPTTQKGIMFPSPFPTLAQYRKGIAAGAGVILTGVLTWAETADLEPVIGPLVPEPFRPLVGVVLGGVALTASVILASNAPKPDSESDATSSSEPAAAAYPLRPSPATVQPSAALAQLVAGVAANSAPVSNETSVVTLLDPPVRTPYQ